MADVVNIEPRTPGEPGYNRGVGMKLRTHNILDYVGVVFLLIAPSLFGFQDVIPARNTFLNMGFALLVYSLLTNYRYSLFKWIPVGVHMTLDVILGAVLILAPWMFGYRNLITDGQLAVHGIYGVAVFLLVGFTRTRTETRAVPEDLQDITQRAA